MSRPSLHFTPSKGWMNDPVGVTHHAGAYHLFFQHVPGGTTWAPACEWGHATSPDLVHWTEGPIGLRPAPDEVGAWSGCVVPDGSGRLLYTSVRPGDVERGRVREAMPVDGEWRTWQPGRVVVTPPAELPIVSFRDPSVFRDGDHWKMLVGARLSDGTAAALLFTSPDLDDWTYAGPLATRHTSEQEPVWTGTMWECPHLVRTPQGDVLVVSVCGEDGLYDVAAAVGTYDGSRFAARSWQRLTSGAPYAATVFTDLDGTPGLLTWLRDVGDAGEGWAGALSVPLRLDVVDGHAHVSVHPAIAARRRRGVGGCSDLEWDAHPGAHLDVSGAVLTADTDELRVVAGDRTATLPASREVRVLVDGPVLEVAAGGVFAALPLEPADATEPRASAGPLRRWVLGRERL